LPPVTSCESVLIPAAQVRLYAASRKAACQLPHDQDLPVHRELHHCRTATRHCHHLLYIFSSSSSTTSSRSERCDHDCSSGVDGHA
jgi:hypothetical protein